MDGDRGTRLPRGFAQLRDEVTRRTPLVGFNPGPVPGARFYRFPQRTPKQIALAPGLTLALMLQGRKLIRAGTAELRYGPPQLLVLTGEQTFESTVLAASPSRPYLSMSVRLPAEIVADTMVALLEAEPDLPASAPSPAVPSAAVATSSELPDAPAAYVTRADAAWVGAMTRLLHCADDPLERRMLAPLVLRELAFRLLRSPGARQLRRLAARDGNAAAIRRAMAFIRLHAHESLSVEQLARHVAMSPSHFAHCFRAIACTSPMRYVKLVRLERARVLLIEGGRRASEAAAEVGYASASHFTRDFKGLFGAPPGTYARRLRAAD